MEILKKRECGGSFGLRRCRWVPTLPKELRKRRMSSLTPAEVHPNLVDAIWIENNKAVSGGCRGVAACFTNGMTELNPEAQRLQCNAFEMSLLPLLTHGLSVHSRALRQTEITHLNAVQGVAQVHGNGTTFAIQRAVVAVVAAVTPSPEIPGAAGTVRTAILPTAFEPQQLTQKCISERHPKQDWSVLEQQLLA